VSKKSRERERKRGRKKEEKTRKPRKKIIASQKLPYLL
jgi:hypothetical protein